MTALTVFFTNAASSTLSTANLLYTTSGSPSTTSASTLVNTATGWGEIYSQGNASAWAAAGSEPSPSGHGWLLDSTVLEGNQFAAANWSGTIVVENTNGSTSGPITTFHLRAYKRSSGGSYTNIVDIAASSATLTGFSTSTISFSATAGSATTFSTGDKLYIDIPADITFAASGSGSIKILNLSIDTSGHTGSTSAEMVSPGYSSSGGGATHLRIQDGMGGVFS